MHGERGGSSSVPRKLRPMADDWNFTYRLCREPEFCVRRLFALLKAQAGEQKATDFHCTKIGGVPYMTSPERYRRFAQECLEMARATKDAPTRATLLQMAQVWFRLAQEKASNSIDEKVD